MVFPPPGIARQDWKIVRALGEFVGVTLPYSEEEEMEERVQTLVPLTLNMDEVSRSSVRRKRFYYRVAHSVRAAGPLLSEMTPQLSPASGMIGGHFSSSTNPVRRTTLRIEI